MKWIKASERFPKRNGIYFIKVGGIGYIGSFVLPPMLLFKIDGDDYFLEKKEQFENVEWLDETETHDVSNVGDRHNRIAHKIGDGRVVIDGETYVNEKSSRVLTLNVSNVDSEEEEEQGGCKHFNTETFRLETWCKDCGKTL